MGGKQPFAGIPRCLAGVGVDWCSFSRPKALTKGASGAISVAVKACHLLLTDLSEP